MTTSGCTPSVEQLATPGVTVRSRENRERGSSAVESGLTVAGVAVFLTPFLFYLGMQVRQGLDAPCDTGPVACAEAADGSATDPGPGPGPGPGPAPSPGPDPTVTLQGRVPTVVAGAWAVCDGQTTLTPARNTTATCTVTFADGRTRDYLIRWLDDAGSIRMSPRGPSH